MRPRHAGKISELALAASVELEEGESVRYRGPIILRQAGVRGELSLTSNRLIWIRHRIVLPFIRKLAEVPLGDVEGWSIEPAPWWIGWRIRWRVRRMVRLRTRSGVLDLIPEYSADDAQDWAKALEEVFGGMKTAPHEAS